MKGCLKLSTPLPSLGPFCKRKCVVISEEEEVHIADEWDRTPTEPARHLSYRELLELKEIQRSLPRANQKADPFTGKAQSHFLSRVPVVLLPLLPDTDTPPTPAPTPIHSNSPSPPQTLQALPPFKHSPSPSPIIPGAPLRTAYTPPLPTFCNKSNLGPRWTPPPPPSVSVTPAPSHLAYVSHISPASPTPQRSRPSFSFLPLLDTPPSSTPSTPIEELYIDIEGFGDIESENSPIEDTTPIYSCSEPPSLNSSPPPPPPSSLGDDSECDESSSQYSHDPPTPSLTNASLDSPPSRTRSLTASPEPSEFDPPPRYMTLSSSTIGSHDDDDILQHNAEDPNSSYFPPFPSSEKDERVIVVPQPIHAVSMLKSRRLEALTSPALTPPSPLSLYELPSSLTGKTGSLRNLGDVSESIIQESVATPTPPAPQPASDAAPMPFCMNFRRKTPSLPS